MNQRRRIYRDMRQFGRPRLWALVWAANVPFARRHDTAQRLTAEQA